MPCDFNYTLIFYISNDYFGLNNPMSELPKDDFIKKICKYKKLCYYYLVFDSGRQI